MSEPASHPAGPLARAGAPEPRRPRLRPAAARADHLPRQRRRGHDRQPICAQLLLLAAEDANRDISLYINSPGGSVTAGMAIYDTMEFIPNDVSTVAMGLAASMGQFLLCAGTKGKRYALPHARIMMHQPSGGIGGTAADIAIQAEQMLHTKRTDAAGAHRLPHRPDRRADRRGLRPRPLVHRRGGQGVRLRRPRRVASAAQVPSAGAGQLRGDAHEPAQPVPITASRRRLGPRPRRYVLPNIIERTSRGEYGMDPYSKLLKERIVFLGVQIDDVSANDVMAQLLLPRVRGPRPRHQHLHQLARRLVHRAHRDLRHDAVHPPRHLDRLPGPGRRRPPRCCSPRAPRASGSRSPTRAS